MKTRLDIPIAGEALTQVKKEQRAGACAIVIFGGAGDLTTRKLLPALFDSFCKGLLADGCSIVAVGMPILGSNDYRDLARRSIKKSQKEQPIDKETLDRFLALTHYVAGALEDPVLYKSLDTLVCKLSEEQSTPDNRLYYLSVPPSVFGLLARNLHAQGMSRVRGPHHWIRVIVEKPFGRDLESARTLNQELEQAFEEWQIYRIDHYLAKEPVQNIMALRFANGIFEPLWNRNHIEYVQITAAETVGVEKRGHYFEESGALRDMVQNHLMQLIALVAMEPPSTFDANAVRDEHAKVLRSIRPIPKDKVDELVVRGQYGGGVIGNKKVQAYRSELDVDPASNIETYVAAKLLIDNWRWADVPFYIRTGKRLPKQTSEIAVFFRKSPHLLFRRKQPGYVSSNVLVLRIQTEESISLTFEAKVPGNEMTLQSVDMHFRYEDAFGRRKADPYARLILDCMKGDATLFMRKDSVEVGWWLMTPILEHWRHNAPLGLPNYPAGTWGPEDASLLLGRDGRKWRRP